MSISLSSLLPLPVVAPLAGAVLTPLLARASRRLPLPIAAISLLGSTVLLILMAPRVFSGHVLTHYMGGWTPVHGAVLGIAFTADPFGLLVALATAGIGTLLAVYTLSELGGLGARELGGYACLVQLLIAALIGAAITGDLFNLFVWFEVAALSSYGLTGFFLERPIALEAAFKILVLTTLAGFALFIGIGLLYADHGALNYGQLHTALGRNTRPADKIALGLLAAGFATKAGLVPFHGWLADAHTAAPGPVSALFSGLMVNMGIVAIARLGLQIFPRGSTPILGALTVIGVMSALVGAVLALAQDDLKRLLAYDTVSQMGVLAVGVGTGSPAGVGAATYHLLNHALFKSLLFLCAGAVVHRTGWTSLRDMGGLARRMPVTAVAFTVGVAAIAGVPPLNGYVSLGLLHSALLDDHAYTTYALMLLAQLVTIAALGRAGWLAFFRPRRRRHDLEQPRPGMLAAFAGLCGCCLAFGLFPGWTVSTLISPAVAGLEHAFTSTLPAVAVTFRYADPAELAVTLVSVALAIPLVYTYLRHDEPRPVRLLRAVHTGSVNDYAALAVTGTIAVAVVLLR